MTDDAEKMALALRLFFDGPERVALDGGLTVHLIAQSEVIGPGRDLAGSLLVEQPDGAMRRINGRELAAFAERNPWVKRWRLEVERWQRRADEEEEEEEEEDESED